MARHVSIQCFGTLSNLTIYQTFTPFLPYVPVGALNELKWVVVGSNYTGLECRWCVTFYFPTTLNNSLINIAVHLEFDSHSSLASYQTLFSFQHHSFLSEFLSFNGVSSPTHPCSYLCKLSIQNKQLNCC